MQFALAALFWLLAVVALYTGWQRGDSSERTIVIAAATAIVATLLATAILAEGRREVVILAIDIALAVVAVSAAGKSGSYWPLWYAGFTIVGALTGVANYLMGADYWLFRLLSGFWAIPGLIVIIAGSRLDTRYQRRLLF